MKPIKHIRILGNKHPVEFLEAPIVKGKGKKADFRWGEIVEGKDGVIRAYKGSNYITLDTLFHEIVHSILDGLGRTDLSRDEKFVARFSLALTDTLLNNKDLPSWIAELAENKQ